MIEDAARLHRTVDTGKSIDAVDVVEDAVGTEQETQRASAQAIAVNRHHQARDEDSGAITESTESPAGSRQKSQHGIGCRIHGNSRNTKNAD